MSKLETNTIDTVSGTTNLVIGSTNSSTVTFENGAATGHMYPAFEARLSAFQNLSNDTDTKVQFDTEVFDTDSCYDNSTNYRFTPTVAGKYLIYGNVRGSASTNLSNLEKIMTFIYKNGSQYNSTLFRIDFRNNNGTQASTSFSQVLELNGSTDYVEIYSNVDVSADTPARIHPGAFFGAYRIGA